jgi:hypothetical protein
MSALILNNLSKGKRYRTVVTVALLKKSSKKGIFANKLWF